MAQLNVPCRLAIHHLAAAMRRAQTARSTRNGACTQLESLEDCAAAGALLVPIVSARELVEAAVGRADLELSVAVSSIVRASDLSPDSEGRLGVVEIINVLHNIVYWFGLASE